MTTEVMITHLTKGYPSKLHVISYNPNDPEAAETVEGTIENGQHLRVSVHRGQSLRIFEEE